MLDWNDHVICAFDELRLVGSGSPIAARRLRGAFENLKTIAPAERAVALDEQIELLDTVIRRAYEDERDVRAALVADRQGVDSGEDILIDDALIARTPARRPLERRSR